jgi:hypothetical protein|nr:MAG TPA: hypothetical protein [Caudoviricetes sp.]
MEQKFKDGDILIINNLIIGIFKKYNSKTNSFEFHFTKSIYQMYSFHASTVNLKLATEEERNEFYSYLASMKLIWNSETKTMDSVSSLIEDYVKFKDGDILTYKGSETNYQVVFKKYFPRNKNRFIIYTGPKDDRVFDFETEYAPFYRLATEEEIEHFKQEMKGNGYYWNAKLKKFQHHYPRVEKGTEFFYIDMFGNVKKKTDNRDDFSSKCHKNGNYFKSHDAAKHDAEWMKHVFQKNIELDVD